MLSLSPECAADSHVVWHFYIWLSPFFIFLAPVGFCQGCLTIEQGGRRGRIQLKADMSALDFSSQAYNGERLSLPPYVVVSRPVFAGMAAGVVVD